MAIGPPRLLHPACARKQAETSHKGRGTSHCTKREQEAPLEEEKERKKVGEGARRILLGGGGLGG